MADAKTEKQKVKEITNRLEEDNPEQFKSEAEGVCHAPLGRCGWAIVTLCFLELEVK